VALGKFKLGFFDSGIGGLVVLRSVRKFLPEYDYVYFGDTANIPYGTKSKEQIYDLTKRAVEFLFRRGCLIVILACNTASATALRKLQKKYLPAAWPGHRVLGVVVPTLEAAFKEGGKGRIGVLATNATVRSGAYRKELRKIWPAGSIYQYAASDLVPVIEAGDGAAVARLLRRHVVKIKTNRVKTIILACTHFPLLRNYLLKLLKQPVKILSQDRIIPIKLRSYLRRHTELRARLSQFGSVSLYYTASGSQHQSARKWFPKAKVRMIT
jgi:glutamate racemase